MSNDVHNRLSETIGITIAEPSGRNTPQYLNTAYQLSEVKLPRRGTLVAWTTQGFPPGAPYKGPTGKDFVPFGVGLVQLDDVIRVEGRLTENDPKKLQFGMDVELTMVPFTTDEEGNELVTFAFQPV